jgi:hypothetical protein
LVSRSGSPILFEAIGMFIQIYKGDIPIKEDVEVKFIGI